MPFSKIAHASALTKVAAADLPERRDAIDAGFERACDVMELNVLQRTNLAKFAAVALSVLKPTRGLAKIAADFTAADTLTDGQVSPEEARFRAVLEKQQRLLPAAPLAAGGVTMDRDAATKKLFMLQRDAKQLGVPVEQLAKTRNVDIAAITKIVQAAPRGPVQPSPATDDLFKGMNGPDLAPAPKPPVPAPKPPVPALKPPVPAPKPPVPAPKPVTPPSPAPPVLPGGK